MQHTTDEEQEFQNPLFEAHLEEFNNPLFDADATTDNFISKSIIDHSSTNNSTANAQSGVLPYGWLPSEVVRGKFAIF